MPTAKDIFASERLRHAAIAIVVAVVVAATTILRPLDITVWSLQAKLFDHSPSSEIAFVEFERQPGARAAIAENRLLTKSLRNLDLAGADRIFIDLPIQRSGSLAVDSALRGELQRLSGKIALTRTIGAATDGSVPVRRSNIFFEQGMQVVSNDYQTDFLGYVWGIEPAYRDVSEELPALWTALARRPAAGSEFAPDYSVDTAEIPRFQAEDIANSANPDAQAIDGKTVVIGAGGGSTALVKVPGGGAVPSSLVHIVAAETAKRGVGHTFDWPWLLGAFGGALLLCLLLGRKFGKRRYLYAGWAVLCCASIILAAYLGIRSTYTGPMALGATFVLLRGIANFKRRHLYVEPRSRLPNFLALQRDAADACEQGHIALVVAKIARLDAVFTTLSQGDQSRYLKQLASRLALGDENATIYYDGSKYFAFILPASEYPDIAAHLEGLRAVASQSITVSQYVLDVSMTIGADQSSEKSISSRLRAATAAADQAREAYRPVFVISDFAADSEEWDYSLQSRLEQALSEDRIGIKLQPQASLGDGRIVGVEALARWVDEERGEIAPSRFILQCERVGRLDELTKRVLTKSLEAGEELQRRAHDPRISVNVSAIQFVDGRIADLIERNLAAHKVEPSRLTIEVTETARIENFGAAREIIEQIKRQGVTFSMDDFGVASANLEALYELPFDELKIDQLFVGRMRSAERARAIVANVTRLARDAGLVSVAEGIEDAETYALLREMGCDLGQGYYIARPLALGELQEVFNLQKDSPLLQRGLG